MFIIDQTQKLSRVKNAVYADRTSNIMPKGKKKKAKNNKNGDKGKKKATPKSKKGGGKKSRSKSARYFYSAIQSHLLNIYFT